MHLAPHALEYLHRRAVRRAGLVATARGVGDLVLAPPSADGELFTRMALNILSNHAHFLEALRTGMCNL